MLVIVNSFFALMLARKLLQVKSKELQKSQRLAAKTQTSHSPFVSHVVLPSRWSVDNE
uniref:Uncharacterized protein n=1 Tax=Solanum lycopersicum TaxID=4081 RepID=K4CZT6_SOLLC